MFKTASFLFCMLSIPAIAQKTDTLLLEKLMRSQPEQFNTILNHPQKHQVQVLYTQVIRDKNKKPVFKSYSYNLNDHHYFYPASTVKLATVIFALEKINELKVKGLTAKSTMITDSSLCWTNQSQQGFHGRKRPAIYRTLYKEDFADE